MIAKTTKYGGQSVLASLIKYLSALCFLGLLPVIFHATAFADYLLYITARMMILGLYAMSFDLLLGYTGILSFGHAAFLGCGAYTTAILMARLDLQILDAFPAISAALFIGILLGWVVGFLCSRVGPMAIFLVTFAFTESFQLLVIADPLGITNAEDGITGIPRQTLFGLLNIKPEMHFYYLVLIVLGLSFLALYRIVHSSFGDVLTAIRENPLRVQFLGYRIRQYRIAAFMISGLFASLAGALTASHEKSVAPEMLGWIMSGDAVLYTVLGGTGTLIGPVLGAFAVVILQEILSDIFPNWLIFLGLIYMALIMFLPKGLFPFLSKIRIRLSRSFLMPTSLVSRRLKSKPFEKEVSYE